MKVKLFFYIKILKILVKTIFNKNTITKAIVFTKQI